MPNGGHCVYYPLNLFRNMCSFENWGIFSNIPVLAWEYLVTCRVWTDRMDYKVSKSTFMHKINNY